jgi:hypothetical protein
LGAEAPPPISDPAPPTLLKNDKQCTAREDLFMVAKDAEKEIKDINLQGKGARKQIQN